MNYYEIGESLQDLNAFSIALRLCASIVLGGLIGIDREIKNRAAGFKTHAMVCLGAALVMLIGNFIYLEFNQTGDVARLGAQVINGIGFLGVGTIVVANNRKVRGLTTAAGLWTCACIGLAIGIGFYFGAFFSCFLSVFLLKVLNVIDKRIRKKSYFTDIYIELDNAMNINTLINFIENNSIDIVNLESVVPKVSTSEIGINLIIKLGKNIKPEEIIYDLGNLEITRFIHRVYT